VSDCRLTRAPELGCFVGGLVVHRRYGSGMISEPGDVVPRKRSPKQVRKRSTTSAAQLTLPGPIGVDRRLPSQVSDEPWIWVAVSMSENAETGDANDGVGKWMVFVPTANVDRAWAKIQKATLDGRLGDVAKVATTYPSPLRRSPGEHVICVYTLDYTDKVDVARVLAGLRELGFTQRLSYKTDAATYAGRYGDGAATYVSPPGATWFDER
jgi:hypothetical protein